VKIVNKTKMLIPSKHCFCLMPSIGGGNWNSGLLAAWMEGTAEQRREREQLIGAWGRGPAAVDGRWAATNEWAGDGRRLLGAAPAISQRPWAIAQDSDGQIEGWQE
jgi:hypothetical protein